MSRSTIARYPNTFNCGAGDCFFFLSSRAYICCKVKRHYDSEDLLKALISLSATLPLPVMHSHTQT